MMATVTSPAARVRTVLVVVLLSLAVVLAPVAVVGTWVRAQLVDTDTFVETLAPLAREPEVQDFLATQVTAAIEARLDVDALVTDLVQGLGLDLSPRAQVALRMLLAPMVESIRGTIRSAADAVVTSPQFATVWEATLRQSHARTTALLRGDPGTTLQLSDEGVVSLPLGPIVAQVKQRLLDRGVELARLIPEVDRSVPLVQADQLVSARQWYQFAVALGWWLPWLSLVLLVAGLVLARRRLRAFTRTSVGLVVAFALLWVGMGIARWVFVDRIGAATMPESTARVVFDQVTSLLSPLVTGLFVVAVVMVLVGWVCGPSVAAVRLRGVVRRGVDLVRRPAGGKATNSDEGLS